MNGINEYDADILERRVHFAIILFVLASEYPFTLPFSDRAGTMPLCGTLRNGFQRDSNTEHTPNMHEYFEQMQ
jgi:hypothetical protein